MPVCGNADASVTVSDMRLQRITIDDVRNLREIRLTLSPRLNIFYGENASGKTSFLESIHLLAYAKSFRSHQLKHVVNRESRGLRVTAQLAEQTEQTVSVGIEFHDGQLRMRAKGKNLKKTSELAQFLPVITLHQECQRLLSDGPRLRRKFLDWGVFHVEPDFLANWRRYARVLKQRNMALHTGMGKGAVLPWDKELSECAQSIDKYREQYCDMFIPLLDKLLDMLLSDNADITVRYRPGWDKSQTLLSVLQDGYETDARRGFTHYGPHRADLLIKAGGVTAHENLSRGQQKLLVCALLIAQAQLHSRHSGKPCVILIDDLKAELDLEHIRRVICLLESLNTQLIMTSTEKELLTPFCHSEHKTFHVERGCINEVL